MVPLPAGSVVLAFGDSVTWHRRGAGEDWPSRLAELTGWRVVNAGIPGDTAEAATGGFQPCWWRTGRRWCWLRLAATIFCAVGHKRR